MSFAAFGAGEACTPSGEVTLATRHGVDPELVFRECRDGREKRVSAVGRMDLEFLKRLRLVGMIEAVSTLVLFGIAIPLKYLAGIPAAVSLVGPIHGILFLLLACMCYLAIERVPIGRRLGYAGIVAAFFPFGPFVIDRWLVALENQG